MSSSSKLQSWLRASALSGLIVPSTDEFLSEFAPPANRRLQWVSGFRGSTGVALILRDSAALFLDARYLAQGYADIGGESIAVERTAADARRKWLRRFVPPGSAIGIDPRCHSVPDLALWRELSSALRFELRLLDQNPIDLLWTSDRPLPHAPRIVDYPECHAGARYQDKCKALIAHLQAKGLRSLLVADPEDVSWLLNVRASAEALRTAVGDWPVVPSCRSRLLVHSDGRIVWFVDRATLSCDVVARRDPNMTIASPDDLAEALTRAAREGPVGLDPRSTPAALVALIERECPVMADDEIARRRWCKDAIELAGARRAHVMDAVAVVRFMAWLTRSVPLRTISEFEAAEQLESFRASNPQYKGPSMPLMSASGPSGAQPHYVPRGERCRRLNDHPIYWMDSGGHYPGGTTDNTVTLALSEPEPRHVLVHTIVLQSFIALATARFPLEACGIHLDTIARRKLWAAGLDCSHGIGHGVGNNLNIHEGPGLGFRPLALTTVPLQPGMIVTNEPGYYAADDFGVRIESHMCVVASSVAGFLELDTISRLPIDPRLVDFTRLSSTEIEWLAGYHRIVLRDLEPHLESIDAGWLRATVSEFTRRSMHEG